MTHQQFKFLVKIGEIFNMVVLQCINKIIQTSDYDIVLNNNLSKEMFLQYEDEFEYIDNFYKQYKKVPDKETFLNQFPDFNLIEVAESDKYLIDKINEEYLYFKTVPVVQNVAEKLKSNSDEAVEYLLREIPKLTALQRTEGIDIIQKAEQRFNEYQEKLTGKDEQYITTGFEELDTIFKGFNRRRRISCIVC